MLHVFRRLSKRGIKCFLQWKDVVPGEKFDVITSDAMQKSRYILLFVGPSGVGSWHDQRQLNLLESLSKDGSNRIIPIFLPGTPPTITHKASFLRNIQAINMKAEDDPVAVEFLARVISRQTTATPVELDAPFGDMQLSTDTHFDLIAPRSSRQRFGNLRYGYAFLTLVCLCLVLAVMFLFRRGAQQAPKELPSASSTIPPASGPPMTPSSPDPSSASDVPLNYVLGNVVSIMIHVASTRDPQDAEKVAAVLRAHGYVVKGITSESLDQAPHETTVRFFQYDKSTVSTGKALVKLLQTMGLVVRTEFDNEFVGQTTVPDAGTYELYLGSTKQDAIVGVLLTSFSVDVPLGIFKAGRAGTYDWVASASGSWVENLNGKYVNTFEFSARAKLDGCNGGIFQKVGSTSEKVFLPDTDCPTMVLKYSNNQVWQNVAQIEVRSPGPKSQ